MVMEFASLEESDRRAQLAYRSAAKKRLKFMRSCKHNTDLQSKVIEKARRDPAFFIDHFAWTYDPRNASKDIPPYVPFELYPRQRELLARIPIWRKNKTKASIPKCRGVGASWILMAYACWAGLFEKGFKGTFGSRTKDSVDKIGDPDSLFEKARILLTRLPKWFLAVVAPSFDTDTHIKEMTVRFPDTGSALTGQVGKNMGVGGRATLYVWDEAAKSDDSQTRLRGILQNTETLVEISTPNGVDNTFFERIDKGIVERFDMPWHCVPWRDENWLERQRQEMAHDPIGFAQEVLMDFLGSGEDAVIPPLWVSAAVNYNAPAGDHISFGYDVALSGDLNVAIPRTGAVVLDPEVWSGLGTKDSAARVLRSCGAELAKHLFYDVIGVGEGIRSQVDDITPAKRKAYKLPKSFRAKGISFAGKPTKRKWANKKTSRDQFSNLRAELYWNLRERFRKTFENVSEDAGYPLEECISIPDHAELKSQLSWLKQARTSGAKIAVEGKADMKRRRNSRTSCDYSDALAYAFADDVIVRARGPRVRSV